MLCRSPATEVYPKYGVARPAPIISNLTSPPKLLNNVSPSALTDPLSPSATILFKQTAPFFVPQSAEAEIEIMAAFPDIDKPGKYPIVLSDALLGKATKEVYTGVRCTQIWSRKKAAGANKFPDNHKPDSSPDSSTSMRLVPSDSDPNSFDLAYRNNSDRYSYQGIRTSGDGKYVLIFDPLKKHFVLHRVDSTFEMNLVSAPWDKDRASLRKQYSQIATSQSNTTSAIQPAKRKPAAKAKAATVKVDPTKPRKKPEKATKPKPPPRAPTPEEEEESDDGLEVEDPDGGSSQTYQYHPTPTFQRHDSEDAIEEDSDAEGEEYEDERERNQDVDLLKLPSPANNAGGLSEDEEMELDLEAELEQALANGGDDSSESEEE
jgi:RNA polymerase II transcription elongation factor